MTRWFVTRHQGAVAWAERHGIDVDRVVHHLDVALVAEGDTVIGTLPVNLAAEVCARGGRFLYLALTVPLEWRGRELSADDLDAFGAELVAYTVQRRGTEVGPTRD